MGSLQKQCRRDIDTLHETLNDVTSNSDFLFVDIEKIKKTQNICHLGLGD